LVRKARQGCYPRLAEFVKLTISFIAHAAEVGTVYAVSRSTMIGLSEAAETNSGIYSISEVARYLQINPATLRQWFFPTDKRKILLRGRIDRAKEGTWLTFHDFLQAYAVKILKSAGAKAADVRDAIFEARETYDLPYPLSVKGHIVYADEHGTIHILPPGHHHPVVMAGKGKGQGSFGEVVKKYLKRLEFDDKGIANRFIVFEKVDANGAKRRAIMDPKTNFGEPTVEGTPYRVETLVNAVEIEGGIENAARIYEVSPDDVIVAMEAFRNAPEFKAAA
jgi:uncharacterized protein (DUF433 family)